MAVAKEKIKDIDMNRERKSQAKEDVSKSVSVSAGAIEKVVDYVANPTRDKIREVTIISRTQGLVFPLLDMLQMGKRYLLQVAEYRIDPEAYGKEHPDAPIPENPDMLDEYEYRVAQWQKSVSGSNFKELIQLALTELEVKAAEDDGFGNTADAWKD